MPALTWLRGLRRGEQRAYAKCVVRIRELAQFGHELRRPTADLLRHGIHELRARAGRVQYRILCFFHGKTAAVLASRAAVEIEPEKQNFVNDLGWSLYQAGQVQEAREVLERAAAMDPADKLAAENLRLCRRRLREGRSADR